MAKKKNGNKMWITGAVLGAVAGAAYALWKTPMSGEELRGKLATGPVAQGDDVVTDKTHTPGAGAKLLTKVEQTLAPIVGVELGKTANGNGAVTEPIVAAKAEAALRNVPADEKFEAAERVSAQASNPESAAGYGTDSIRAQRFAWGSPTPEAGLSPTPDAPMAHEVVPEATPEPAPEQAREPAREPLVGGDSPVMRKNRFEWGEPAPNANGEGTAAASSDSTTSGATHTAGSVVTEADDRPIEPVTSEAASLSGAKKREFPKLGGLE